MSIASTSMQPWTEHETYLLTLLRPHLTTDELVAVFLDLGYARTVDAITGKANRAGIAMMGCNVPDMENFSVDEQAVLQNILGRRAANIQAIRKQEQEDVDSSCVWLPTVKPPALVIRATLEDLKGKLDQILSDTATKKKPKKAAKKDPAACVLMLSDLHFGQKTDKFDIAEASRRIKELPERLEDALKDCDEITVCFIGDMVEGEEIYATQQSNLEVTLLGQVEAATASLWEMLLGFNLMGLDVIVQTVPGNHGRMSKTANETTNWDNIVYMQLGILANMHNSEALKVELNYSEFAYFPVLDKKILMNHHGTKHLGTPAMKVKMAGWQQTTPYDCFVHGHYHQWRISTLFGVPIVSNGSLVGPDSLAQRMGESDPARQGYFFARNGEPFNNFSFLEW